MKKTTTRTTGNFCFISNSLNGNRKAFFQSQNPTTVWSNQRSFKTKSAIQTILLPEKHPSSDGYIALLEGVEPWEAADSKRENRGIVCILPQVEKSVREKPCRSQHLCRPPNPREQFRLCQLERGILRSRCVPQEFISPQPFLFLIDRLSLRSNILLPPVSWRKKGCGDYPTLFLLLGN